MPTDPTNTTDEQHLQQVIREAISEAEEANKTATPEAYAEALRLERERRAQLERALGSVATAELAAALIAVFEGERLEAYQDTGGVWTIGIGHTKGVRPGQKITHAQAVELFAQDCAPLLNMVHDRPLLEAAALVSFGFNCGSGALAKVLGGHDLVTNPVHTTDRKGTVLRGLVARRRLEELLILASDQIERKPAA